MIVRQGAVGLVIALSIACSGATSNQKPEAYYPSDSWRTSTPEAQGMDSGALLDLIDHVADAEVRLHHLSIIRHGHLILSADFFPYDQTWPHDIVSGTKSVTSTLVGIASDDGLIDIDAPVMSFFPGLAANQAGSRERGMTVRHLLTMTSGLCDGFDDNAQQLESIRQSALGAVALLEGPLKAEPGSRFAYCDGASQLLSAILTEATGMPASEYAQNRLFEPLGIDSIIWPRDPRGDNTGWGDSFYRPLDLARIGYLYLHNGKWGGEQVLSEDWVREATRAHVATPDGERYGFQWWVSQDGMYEARGRGGQRLIVWPEQDLVIVMLGAGFDPSDVGRFIVAALLEPASGPNAPDSYERLQRRLATAAASAEAGTEGPLPAMADRISGRTFRFEANDAGLEWFALTFDSGKEGRIDLSLGDQYQERRGLRSSPMGLDGGFRISPTGRFDLPIAVRGRWVDERTFELIYDEVANTHVYDIRIEFDGSCARWRMSDRTAPFSMVLRACTRTSE